MRYPAELSIVAAVLAVGWMATYGVDLLTAKSDPPRTEKSPQFEMAKDCQVNGAELSRSLPEQTKAGLIRSIVETLPHIITVTVYEQGWKRTEDEVQAAIEIGAFCQILDAAGEGIVIIRGAEGGKELERLVNGALVQSGTDRSQ